MYDSGERKKNETWEDSRRKKGKIKIYIKDCINVYMFLYVVLVNETLDVVEEVKREKYFSFCLL